MDKLEENIGTKTGVYWELKITNGFQPGKRLAVQMSLE